MLVQFKVGNFMSFKENVTLSMVKSAVHELPENVFRINDDFELLKSAVVYGANASGKSNLIRAFQFMKFFTIFSAREYQIDEKTGVSPFFLNEETQNKPSFLETVFMIDNIIYRYGFEVDEKRVCKEWLYYMPKTKEEVLFVREGLVFNISEKFTEGNGLKDKTRDNGLFLSVVSQFNGEISSKVIKWFEKIRINISENYQFFFDRTLSRIEEDSSLREDVAKFISVADNGVDNFEIKSINIPDEETEKNIAPKERKQLKDKMVLFYHKVFNAERKTSRTIGLPLRYFESEGTRKMFALSVPIIDALKNGEILIMDELENHLHPLLFKHIIKLFNSYPNKNNAQLIFTTHNLTCLNNECFRRDQIWFTEKNSFAESDLFSLADYKLDDSKKVRNDASYSKDYLLGKYGAVPFIDEINLSFKEKDNGVSK